MHRRNKKKIQHVHVSKNTLTCTYYNNGNDMISCFFRMLIKERINDEIKNENKKKKCNKIVGGMRMTLRIETHFLKGYQFEKIRKSS